MLLIAGLGWLMFGPGGGKDRMTRLIELPGTTIEAVTDADPRLGWDDVTALPDAAWQEWRAPGYLAAEPGRVIWMRVKLPHAGDRSLHGVLADTSYFSDHVQLWEPRGAGSGRPLESGGSVRGDGKPLWGRTAAFPLEVPPGGTGWIYLRVADAYVAHVQPVWWPKAEDYFAAQARQVLAEYLCFGALLALVLYNLVLWVRLQYADTGYYVLTAAVGLAFNFVANGGFALLGVPLGSPGHEMLVAGSLGLGACCMVQFTRAFLGTRELLPRVDRGMRAWSVALVLAVGAIGAMPWMKTPGWVSVVGMASGLTDMGCMAVAVVAWRRGARLAPFFVAAYALLLVAMVPAMMSMLRADVIRGVAMGLLAGRTMEMLLLSFAVAERFAQTQRRLFEETEQRRMIEETYADELELEVRERTRELAETNADKDRMLAVIGHDLRSPLTGLMREADEAPGEFARETARTGRMLLLLIEDLVLWARLRAGTRALAAHPARALLAPAVALHRVVAERGGTALVVDVPDELRVETDLVLAQTLVRNLLANALKFARTRIVLRASAVEGGVRFTVGNDGPPLSPAVAARFSAGEDEPLTATGGLGLRLCREICRALDTRLEAGSDADGGTEFGFTVRAAAQQEETP